jgi:membrane associated rhomboid family serine protease
VDKKQLSRFHDKDVISIMQTSQQVRRAAYFPVILVAVLWIIKVLEWTTGKDIGMYGIRPRSISTLYTIFTGPLIHGSWEHLASNSVPLLVLGWLLFLTVPQLAFRLFFLIYFITSLLVWLAARESFHIGASGIVYGLATFLFFTGIFKKDISSMAISLVVAFLYGGMIWGLLPYQPGISWESHLLGALTGTAMAFIYGKQNGQAEVEESEPGRSFKDFIENERDH